MKDKKIKLQKFLSLFLALIMLFQIPLTSFNIYATEETDISVESNESSEELSTEQSESNEIISSEETSSSNNIEIISDDEKNIDNWELDIVFYDSSVNAGKTALTEIEWDASDENYLTGEPRVITVQINYKATNSPAFEANELAIVIPNLAYGGQASTSSSEKSYPFGITSALLSAKVVLGANDTTHTGYNWNLASEPKNCKSTDYVFTNANIIEEGTSFEDSIQIVYTITPNSNTPEQYLNECVKNYFATLQAKILLTTSRNNEYVINENNFETTITNDKWPSNSSVTKENYEQYFWEYTSPTAEDLIIKFDKDTYMDCYLLIYDSDGLRYSGHYNGLQDKTYYIKDNYIKIALYTNYTSASYKFKADIGAIQMPEETVLSNEIIFNYTRTYNHPWEKNENYTITKTASKIPSMDGFPTREYYWVKYTFTMTGYTTTSYPRVGITYYFEDTLPEDCLILDANIQPITLTNNVYIDSTFSEGNSYNVEGSYYKYEYLYVGYPKSIYNEMTNNLIIENTVDLYIKYNDETEYILADTDSISLNLAEFEFSYDGDLFSISKAPFENGIISSHFLLDEDFIHSCNWCNSRDHISTGTHWSINTTTVYQGTPLTVRVGDDLLYITDTNNNYRKLTDDEYYFSSIYLPQLTNMNGISINYNKYSTNLYVRYANESDYVLFLNLSEYKTGNTISLITQEKKVVGYYIEFTDMEESLVLKHTGFLDPSVVAHIKPTENIAENGSIYNFSYLKVFTKDEEGNLILQNIPTEDSYSSFISKNEIAAFDITTYNSYIQRSSAYVSYTNNTIPSTNNIGLLSYVTNSTPVQNNEKKIFEIKGTLGYGLFGSQNFGGIDTNSNYLQNIYFDNLENVKLLTKYNTYTLLPKGINLISNKTEILESIVCTAYSYYYEDFYLTNGTKAFTNIYEMEDFIKQHSTINIKDNWNNTGRTKIEWFIDHSEIPLLYVEPGSNSGKGITFKISYNMELSYDNFIEYGNVYSNYSFSEAFYNDNSQLYSYYGKTNDKGTLDPDAIDINENGNLSDTYANQKSTITITSVVSTHQSVVTNAKTSVLDYSSGIVYSPCNDEYEYKLKVNTGSADVTSLIIYDNIEMAYDNNEYWQGEFLDVDISYAESKGYIVKTYYSENPHAGNLYNEDGQLNSDWQEYIQHQEEVSGNGLKISFSPLSETYNSYDYLYVYYYYNNQLYRTPAYSGTQLAGLILELPTTDAYFYWYTNGSGNDAYGFKIDTIELTDVTTTIGNSGYTLPSVTPTEITDRTYPETTHSYKNSEKILWHYDGSSLAREKIEGTDKALVKSLAFEYLDSEGNAAILPVGSYTYTIIKMKSINDENNTNYAYNQCRTQWTAIDELGNPVDFITGITSNTTKVTVNDYYEINVYKKWNDNNNSYRLRPDSIDIILKLEGIEIDRKQISKNESTITFPDLSAMKMDLYSLEEAPVELYIPSEFTYIDELNHYEITNTIDEKALYTISGIKTWENDTKEQRPESITLKLLQNGNEIATTTTSADNNWEYTFPTIAKYKPDGTYHDYVVKEVPLDRYITTYGYNGVAITFSKDCYTYSSNDYVNIYYNYNNTMYKLGSYYYNDLSGKVIELPTTDFYIYWHTANTSSSRYGFSIDSIVNKEVTVNPSTTTATLPSYDIQEMGYNDYPESAHNPHEKNANKIWHYTLSTWDVINTRNSINISGTKTWEGDTESQRPESITVKLLQDEVEYTTTTITADDNWKYTFDDVPEFRNDGTKYEYTVEEVPIDRYFATYEPLYNGVEITFSDDCYTYNSNDYIYIYYNYNNAMYRLGTYYGSNLAGKVIELPTTDFYIYWHTSNSTRNYYGFSIDSIVNKEVTTNPSSSKYSLPNYDVEEVTLDNYPESAHIPYDVNANKIWHYTLQTWDITNTRNSINISGTKTWLEDIESQRPESITIKLLQDGIEYVTTTTTADDNWEYSFLDVPEFRSDGTLYEYSVEEIPVDGYTTKYGVDANGVAITFNEQFATESTSYDWVDIYYVLDGITYKLGRWGGANTSTTSLAGKTIEVPSKDFYLWWRTDGSVNSGYGFSIDSIVPANVEHLSTTSTGTLPTGTIEEISGTTYPESAHSPYNNSANRIWHYTCTDVSCSDTPQPGVFRIVNIRSSVSVEINKKDFFTNEALSDISFNLYKLVDTDTTHDHGMATENDCWDSIGTFTTDENGLLILDNLSPDTIYGIVETTPDGYVVPANTYWKMTIGSDQFITFETVGDTDDFYDRYGWTGYRLDIEANNDKYVLYNIPEFRTVEATKRIKASDINFYNGNPTFLFKLSGTDVSNTIRTYYQGVEFTEEYVSANTDSDGYVTITVVFDDLIKGTYILSEEEVSRYSIETISDIENGTATASDVTFDLEANTSGKATFTNKKYESRWFSHNDFVRNHIGEKEIINEFFLTSSTPKLQEIPNYGYKIYNETLTYEEIMRSYIIYIYSGNEIKMPMTQVNIDTIVDGVYMIENLAVFVTEDTIVYGMDISKGLYVTIDPATLPSSDTYIIRTYEP